MPALDHSWAVLTGLCLASALCGYGLRHLLCVHAERASAKRISILCDQLDLKDGKLHLLRAELHAAQAQSRDLQCVLAAKPAAGTGMDSAAVPFGLQSIRIHHVVPAEQAPCLDDDDSSSSFKRHGRAPESRSAAEAAPSRRTG